MPGMVDHPRRRLSADHHVEPAKVEFGKLPIGLQARPEVLCREGEFDDVTLVSRLGIDVVPQAAPQVFW